MEGIRIDNLKHYWGWITFIILIIILTPIITGEILLTQSKYNNIDSPWLGYSGNYLGGIIGGIVAFIVARIQIDANQRQNDKKEKSKNDSIKRLLLVTIYYEILDNYTLYSNFIKPSVLHNKNIQISSDMKFTTDSWKSFRLNIMPLNEEVISVEDIEILYFSMERINKKIYAGVNFNDPMERFFLENIDLAFTKVLEGLNEMKKEFSNNRFRQSGDINAPLVNESFYIEKDLVYREGNIGKSHIKELVGNRYITKSMEDEDTLEIQWHEFDFHKKCYVPSVSCNRSIVVNGQYYIPINGKVVLEKNNVG